jgi:uncharacterized lipoprotein YddW (UPF0748 family)
MGSIQGLIMTRAFRIPLLIFALWNAAATASGGEVRATWIARDGLNSKETLALAMDRAASNHFNVVFVNAWSRGYPLWRSQVFSNETGLAIDPTYSSRDIMAEAVAEGHRNGLQVMAWFEYGFVGGWTGYLPGSSGKGRIFDAHPDWVARQQNGTEIDGSSFYWMTHTRPEVQTFLIRLATELAANYDLDGIELDRIRYPNLAYGYDDYTKSLYASEHGGNQPPATNNSAWIRWRADKLNLFHAAAYDWIKELYPRFVVANAPSAYSSSQYSAYNSFCQDWVWWVNNDKVDSIELQSYVSAASSFSNILSFVATQVPDVKRITPSFALRPNSAWIAYPETLKFVDTARTGGFGGQSVWYYTDLSTSNYFPNFQTNRYQTPVAPDLWPADWRTHRALVMVTNTADAVRAGNWIQSANAGFSGPSFYANAGTPATLDYFLEVPTNGIYEVYAYQVISTSRAINAPWTVFDALGGTVTNLVDQTQSANSRWYKLGDVLLAPGRQRVVQLSNHGIAAGKQVGADAVMISLHRRLSETPVIAGATATTNHNIAVALRGNVGQRFQMQASTNLLDWTTQTTITITNFPTVWSDPNTSSVPAQFYRAALAP